jgi:hypothetical protein
MRRAALALALTALAAGCGGGDDVAIPSCPPPGAALAEAPELPPGFPTPDGVTYTSSREAGPSTLVEGYHDALLEEAFESYKDAFEQASGYAVTQEEQEQLDAEVNFEGGGTDGQVRLGACSDRTDVTITIRPL